ncbi:zinc finger TRAF-type-containing protein 1-B-like [Lineus longissimus]|uniref:zinc finger TRAF-type-containing protein 1-B-like n=1 Tax=Lineus longissimus TaxID=88925 RepID=UPI002B4E57F8
MAEVEASTSAGSQNEEQPDNSVEIHSIDTTENESEEPKQKRIKLETKINEADEKLEDRLNGILRCTVCLDLPRVSMYQCTNGHLMCAMCFSHLLADARLKDEASTCPNCRCEISKHLCSRNLAVEKAVSELPTECHFCTQQLPRHMMDRHEEYSCLERITSCSYERIGCPWKGPYHELKGHEEVCIHPKKTGAEIMDTLIAYDNKRAEEMKIYDKIFNMLSYEKITFLDLQLKPYRTDDFITRLYYETSRFTAFNFQWVVKAKVNDDMKNPALACQRYITYQLILKSRVQNPVDIHFLMVQGPYGEMKICPAVNQHQFTNENNESQYQVLPLNSPNECNKLLAAKTIGVRLIVLQVTS